MDVEFTVRGFGDGKYILQGPDGSFIEKTPAELGVAPPSGGSFLDDSLTQSAMPSAETSGSGIGPALERGGYEAVDLGGSALRFMGAQDTGRAMSDWAQERASQLPQTKGLLEETARMLPSSMAFPMAAQVASYPAMLIPGIGPAVSGVLRGMALAYPGIMGMSQYQQTKEAAIEKGVDPGAAPTIEGIAETAGEIIPMMLFNRILPFAPVFRELGKVAGKNISQLPLGEFVKRAGVAGFGDVSGEMGTAYVQGAAEKAYDIRPDADPVGEMLSVAGPSAVLSFGTAGIIRGGGAVTSRVYNNILSSPAKEDSNFDIRKDVRRVSVASITDAINASGDKDAAEVAKKWHSYAMSQIDQNLPIDLNRPILDVVNHINAPIDLTQPKQKESALGEYDFRATTGTEALYPQPQTEAINTRYFNNSVAPASVFSTPEVGTGFNPQSFPGGSQVMGQFRPVSETISGPVQNVEPTEVAIQPQQTQETPIQRPVYAGSGRPNVANITQNMPFFAGNRPSMGTTQAPQPAWFGPRLITEGRVTPTPNEGGYRPLEPGSGPTPVPNVPRPLMPVSPSGQEAQVRTELRPDNISESDIPVILDRIEAEAERLGDREQAMPAVAFAMGQLTSPEEINFGRNMFAALLDKAGYDVNGNEETYDQIASAMQGVEVPVVPDNNTVSNKPLTRGNTATAMANDKETAVHQAPVVTEGEVPMFRTAPPLKPITEEPSWFTQRKPLRKVKRLELTPDEALGKLEYDRMMGEPTEEQLIEMEAPKVSNNNEPAKSEEANVVSNKPAKVSKETAEKTVKKPEPVVSVAVSLDDVKKKLSETPSNNRSLSHATSLIDSLRENHIVLTPVEKALTELKNAKIWGKNWTQKENGTYEEYRKYRDKLWNDVARSLDTVKSRKETIVSATASAKTVKTEVEEKAKEPAVKNKPLLTFKDWLKQVKNEEWDGYAARHSEAEREALSNEYASYRGVVPAKTENVTPKSVTEEKTVIKEVAPVNKKLESVVSVGMSVDKMKSVWNALELAAKKSKLDADTKKKIDAFMNATTASDYGAAETETLIKAAGYKLDNRDNLWKVAHQLAHSEGYKKLYVHNVRKVSDVVDDKSKTTDQKAVEAAEAQLEEASVAEMFEAKDEAKTILKDMDKRTKVVPVDGNFAVTFDGNRISEHTFKTKTAAEENRRAMAKEYARDALSEKYGKSFKEMSFIQTKGNVKGMSADNLKVHVERLKSSWPGLPKTNVVQRFEQLPSWLKIEMIKQLGPNANKVAGLVYADEIYLVGDRVQNPKDFEMIMAHEAIGHYGVEEILGDRFEPMMLGIYDSFKNDPRMKWVVAHNEIDNMDKDEGKITAAKEFVAELSTSSRMAPPTLSKKILDLTRIFLRKLGFKTRWTDKDIERILAASFTRITTQPKRRIYIDGDEIVSRGMSFLIKADDPNMSTWADSKGYVSDAAMAVAKTLKSFGPGKVSSMSYPEQYLASPEWWQHHALKALFKIAMNRSDLFHENFHRYIDILDDNGISTGKNVLDLNKDITKISLWEKTKGLLSKEAREAVFKGKNYANQRDDIINKMSDSNGVIQWDDRVEEGKTIPGFKWTVQREYDKPVYEMVDALRKSYDRVLDEQVQEMKDIKATLEEEAKKSGVAARLPRFPSYDANGNAITLSLDEAIYHMGSLRGSYAPRIRTGKYVFKASKTVNGTKKLWREQGDSRTALNYKRIQMEKNGWDCTDVEYVERLPEVVNANLRYVDIQAIMDKAFERIDSNKETPLSPTEREKLYMMHGDIIMGIRDELLSRGFRASHIRRRNDVVIGGYETDALKQAVTYFANVASGKAKIETAKAMVEAITPKWEDGKYVDGVGIVPGIEPRVWTVAHKYIQHQLRNSDDLDRIINRAKQIISIKYLGLSLRAPIVNTTSLVISAPPAMYTVLSDHGIDPSFKKIMPALKDGMAVYTKFMIDHYHHRKSEWLEKSPVGRIHLDFMERMTKSGWDNQQFTAAAMGGITSTTVGNVFDNTTSLAMSWFGKSEQMIRGTVLFAGFDLAAQEKGLYKMDPKSAEYKSTFEECCEIAEECSLRANAAYNRPSDPLWTMGDHTAAKLGQLYYMYMKFPHNLMQLLYHTTFRKKQLKASAWLMASPVALSGLIALPFYNVLMSGIGMFLRAFLDEQRDPEKLLREGLNRWFGSDITTLLSGGLMGSLGSDISGSLSIGVEKPTKITDLFGVLGGAYNDLEEAMHQISVGNYARALTKILPNIMSTNIKNYIEGTSGVVTDKGQPVIDPLTGRVLKPTVSEMFSRAITGTEPYRIAEIKRETYQGKKQLLTMKDKRDKLLAQYRLYWSGRNKDPEYLQEVMVKIGHYNNLVRKYGGKNAGMATISPTTLKDQREKFTGVNRNALKLFYETP